MFILAPWGLWEKETVAAESVKIIENITCQGNYGPVCFHANIYIYNITIFIPKKNLSYKLNCFLSVLALPFS